LVGDYTDDPNSIMNRRDDLNQGLRIDLEQPVDPQKQRGLVLKCRRNPAGRLWVGQRANGCLIAGERRCIAIRAPIVLHPSAGIEGGCCKHTAELDQKK
jgi:hypothetical protein